MDIFEKFEENKEFYLREFGLEFLQRDRSTFSPIPIEQWLESVSREGLFDSKRVSNNDDYVAYDEYGHPYSFRDSELSELIEDNIDDVYRFVEFLEFRGYIEGDVLDHEAIREYVENTRPIQAPFILNECDFSDVCSEDDIDEIIEDWDEMQKTMERCGL